MNLKSLKTSEAAEILNLREHEVRALGDEGKIKSYRTDGNHRRYFFDSVNEYKKKILGSEIKEAVVYMVMSEGAQYENKIVKLCEMLGWKYTVLRERENKCFEDSEFKKLIGMIKGNEVKRVLITSLEDVGETKFNFMKEISSYHDVRVIALSELQRELGKYV